MRGASRAAALLSGLCLFAAACTASTGPQANASPSSASAQGSPSSSSSSTPSGGTNLPDTSPSTSPSTGPTGAALAVSGAAYHLGEVGIGYSAVTLSASGGAPPYQWSIGSGAIPGGLTLSNDGQVTGTPSAAGHFNFTVQVNDSAGAVASKAGSIGIYAPMALTQSCASQCSVEEGCTVCGSFGSANGGVAPYRLAVTNGSLPPGMGLKGLTLTGAFPNAGPVGGFAFIIQVTDQFGASGSVSAQFYVFPHIALSTNSVKCVQGSAQCVIQVNYSGGTPNGTPTVTVSAFNPQPGPPRGYSVSASGGVLTFQANGGSGSYTGSVSITLTDQSLCGPGSARCSTTLFVSINL
jgi:hypothetical protein